ncbi:MAG: chloride channel protein [Oligoflexia bacterium]|nr:chloride channel protein [Oligoflexia bacterium]
MGILAGLGSSFFLYSLNYLTAQRQQYPLIMLGLPILGLLFALTKAKYSVYFNQGPKDLFRASRGEVKDSFLYLPPIILISTLLSHLFGASVGRESTAAQMGGGFSYWIPKFLSTSLEHKCSLIVSGLSAGFGAAVGAPLAGLVFGLEITGGWTIRNIVYCTFVSAVSFFITKLVGAPHTYYPIASPEISLTIKTIIAILCLSTFSSLLLYLFFFLKKQTENLIEALPGFLLKSTLVGLILAISFCFMGYQKYAGLGIEYIQFSLLGITNTADPFWKVFFTALSIGSGFKGGEFIPFVFIGSSLGALISKILSAGLLLPTIGFGLFYGAATRTPIACSIMVGEIFGWQYGFICYPATIVTILFLGKRSVFSNG